MSDVSKRTYAQIVVNNQELSFAQTLAVEEAIGWFIRKCRDQEQAGVSRLPRYGSLLEEVTKLMIAVTQLDPNTVK